MMTYGASTALIAGALEEAVNDPELIKAASANDEEETELFNFLRENAGDCQKEAMDLFDSWYTGVQKYVSDHDLEDVFSKQAAIAGIETPLPEPLEIAAELGLYFVPIVGTGLMAKDALHSFYKMFKPGMSWKQRLGHGLLGLLDTGFAALSLFPGLGAVGGAAKAGKLGKLLKFFGKPGRAIAGSIGKLSKPAMGAAKTMRRTAATSKGLGGMGLRAIGYGPGYKAGKIRNLLRAGGRRIPGLRKAKMMQPVNYVNRYQQLGQWQKALRSGKPGGVKSVVGGSGPGSFTGASMAIDQPPMRRLLPLMAGGTAIPGALTGMGSGPSYSTEEIGRRIRPGAARVARRVVPRMSRAPSPSASRRMSAIPRFR